MSPTRPSCPAPARLLSVLALALVAAAPAHAKGQRATTQVGLQAGTGLSLGRGQGAETITHRTPIFLEASLRRWSDEFSDTVWGAALRAELEGGPSAAIVPRIELRRPFDGLEIRPGVGVPFFFAPFSLLGVEGSLAVRQKLSDGLGVLVLVSVDAYFWGSDLPKGSAVVMVNGALGVDLEL